MVTASATLGSLGYGIAAVIWLTSYATAFSVAKLELDAQDLNATDHGEVDDFIRRWAALSRGSVKKRAHPPLATQFPSYGVLRRQEDPTCSWTGGGGCFGDAKCCGSLFQGWCCHSTVDCCQGDPSGCCAGDAFCCGAMTGPESGGCCALGETCCTPTDRKPYVSLPGMLYTACSRLTPACCC